MDARYDPIWAVVLLRWFKIELLPSRYMCQNHFPMKHADCRKRPATCTQRDCLEIDRFTT
jgi:hypothetical protein